MANIEQLKQYNLITYILYILGFFVGLTPIVAIIMNYLKRNEMRGTWLERSRSAAHNPALRWGSLSTSRTSLPCFASMMARLMASVDLPGPPF